MKKTLILFFTLFYLIFNAVIAQDSIFAIENTVRFSTSQPSCAISEPKQADNFDFMVNAKYDFTVSLNNLPTTLNEIKLKCDDFSQEKTISIQPPSAGLKLTCDYTAFSIPETKTIRVSSPNLFSCLSTIYDLPPKDNYVNLFKGWNFVSPTRDTVKSTTCTKVRSIVTIDTFTKVFQTLESTNQLEPLKGYLIKVDEDCSITFEGDYHYPVMITNGWNFIGVRKGQISLDEFKSKIDASCKSDFVDKQVKVVTIHPHSKVFLVPDELVSGYGYLVKANLREPCSLSLPLDEIKTYKIQLVKGQNFISLPLIPSDNKIGIITSSITKELRTVYYFDNNINSYLINTPDPDSGVRLTSSLFTLEAGKGYSFYMRKDAVLEIKGEPYDFQPVELKARNSYMIGGGLSELKLVNLLGTCALGKITLSTIDVDGKPVSIKVDSNTVISPGKGYWISSSNDCTLRKI